MNTSLHRSVVRFLSVLLAAVLPAACLPAIPGLPAENGATPTPTPTHLIGSANDAFGLLHYEYRIDMGAAYSMTLVQDIPFVIWVDQGLVTGGAKGAETVTIQGMDQGRACTTTVTFAVEYSIWGDFIPEDGCKLVLNVYGKGDPQQTAVTTTCSMIPPGFEPAMLFIAPYKGPFEFRRPYQTIVTHPYTQENTVTAELVRLVTPISVGCVHNP